MHPEHYISELLYRYNCVVMPNFGAFLTQVKSASLNKITNTFYPPSKILSFNEQLSSNDGLLVSYMATSENVSYEDMLVQVEEIAKEWKTKLAAEERILLPNIGILWLNKEGKIQFQPGNNVNYLTSSFGLSTYVSSPVTREVLKEEVEALEEKIPFIITPEKRSLSFRPYLKYAAIFLLAISTGFTGLELYENNIGSKEVVQQNAQTEVFKQIEQATFFNTKPMELPAVTIEATKKDAPAAVINNIGVKEHYIIAGAFRIKANAEKKVTQLKAQGYNAAYLGPNTSGLHQVSYDSFMDSEEALQFLRKIKNTVSADAWMLSTK